MTLVDSSVWIDYFNAVDCRQTDQLDALLGTDPVAIGDLILVEVLQGFRQRHHFEIARSIMEVLTVFELLGQQRAIRCAENFRALRKKGATVRSTVDVVIATFCIDQQIPLLHRDRDYEPFHQHLGLRRA